MAQFSAKLIFMYVIASGHILVLVCFPSGSVRRMQNVIIIKLELFDTYVGSIYGYDCEMWGNHKGPEIEHVHLNVLREILRDRLITV